MDDVESDGLLIKLNSNPEEAQLISWGPSAIHRYSTTNEKHWSSQF